MNMQVTVSFLWILFGVILSVTARYHDGLAEQSVDGARSRVNISSRQARDVTQFTPEQRQFQQVALETQNILRAQHCSPPMVLEEEINVRAQTYAEILAQNDKGLIHSTDRNGLYGENLYSVTRSSPITNPDADKVFRTFYTEIANYDFNNPGYAANIAHFSQIVWKDTTRIGVGYAFARAGVKMYVVAQYGPPGNYGWLFRENVLSTTCRSGD